MGDMKLVRLFVLISCLAFLSLSSNAAERTKARLALSAETARPGDTVMAAVELLMPPKWHTYWRNGGDSGTPTKITWEIPQGIAAGEIQWPPPEKYTAADLITYVYHDQVLLLVPLKLASDVPSGLATIKAKVSWLECEEICLPGEAAVEAVLVVGSESKPSKDAGLIESWQKKLPATSHGLMVKARWEKPPKEDSRPLLLEWELQPKPEIADFFPYGGDDFEIGGATERLTPQAAAVTLRKTVKKFGDNWPARVSGLIVTKASATAPAQAFEVNLELSSQPADKAAAPTVSGTAPVSSASDTSLFQMLLLAFLGGLILNIMPCVLPVIALKILGFVNQSKEDPRRVRQLGLVYASGVLVSFLVLAGIVIGVQRAGQVADWGMQFQNPQFVVGMTILVTLVALNLFGLFEVTLSGGAMQAATTLAYKEGNAGAFFNGVLATALATPCTAPALASALGFAFSQPPGIIVLMFSTVGLGLAAPYVVLSWKPGWLKFLPKPGAWMEKFKIAMGFPMLATAVWLLWLTTSHYGRDGVLWIGIFLASISLAAWMWGEFVQRGRKHRGVALAMCLAVVAGAYVVALEKELNWRSPARLAKSEQFLAAHPDGIQWRPWSSEAVEEARAAGHPVLVDFTADWCLSCKFNKKTSLEIPSVRTKLKEIDAVALIGDYTNKDPKITEELRKHGRAGVPLVLVYPADPASLPEVLPVLLTPGKVLDALNKAASSKGVSQVQAGAPQP
ncbi:MAG: thioredoxin family protein [Verrucomicrobia bacterium]|nr:thioredoxin family protein [Verrucomicrobiota bacterium]